MRPKLVVVAGVLLGGLMTGVALATSGSGVTSTLLSGGTFTSNAHAKQSANADAQIVDVASDPGGYTRSSRTTAEGDHMRKALLTTVVVLALTGAACGGGSGGGGSDCTSENATKLTGTLTIKNFAFSPNCFSVTSGSTISVANRDFRGHNFTVKGTHVAVPVPGGETGQATAPAPGTYDFLCTIHPGMKGTIIVT